MECGMYAMAGKPAEAGGDAEATLGWEVLTDCGPCDHGGSPVRTRIAVWWLPASLRAFCLARLTHGEQHYGTPLREGWEPAGVELRQEVADAVAYAFAARRPGLAFVLGLVWRLL